MYDISRLPSLSQSQLIHIRQKGLFTATYSPIFNSYSSLGRNTTYQYYFDSIRLIPNMFEDKSVPLFIEHNCFSISQYHRCSTYLELSLPLCKCFYQKLTIK